MTKKNAYRHMETHLPGHECEKCRKTFSNREALNVHIKKNHSNNKEFETLVAVESSIGCETIEKANDVIDGEKSYSDQMNILTIFNMTKMMTEDSTAWCCLVCGKSWVVREKCRRHMQTHLLGVTLPCARCGKMFGCKNSLNKHNGKCLRKGQTLTEETVVVVGDELEEAEELVVKELLVEEMLVEGLVLD